jgi:hypothetical protein
MYTLLIFLPFSFSIVGLSRGEVFGIVSGCRPFCVGFGFGFLFLL